MAHDILKLGELAAGMSDAERLKKREYSRQAWAAGWQDRILAYINQQGSKTLGDFLMQHPGIPYVDLQSVIPFPVAPVQILRLQLAEAKRLGKIREVAMDTLSRAINRAFTAGWNKGENPQFRWASAASDFITDLAEGEATDNLKVLARKVCQSLKELDPPVGWQPTGPADPLIQEAFGRGWPQTGD